MTIAFRWYYEYMVLISNVSNIKGDYFVKACKGFFSLPLKVILYVALFNMYSFNYGKYLSIDVYTIFQYGVFILGSVNF